MTDTINKIIKELKKKIYIAIFGENFINVEKLVPAEDKEVEELITSALEKAIQESRDDERDKIVARLAVEIMEVELHKNRDLYTDGHIHGVKRPFYLIRH